MPEPSAMFVLPFKSNLNVPVPVIVFTTTLILVPVAALTDAIESAGFIPEGFVLEVSSPGVFRQLSTAEHFKRSIGKRVCIYLNKKTNLVSGMPEVKRVTGVIDDFKNETIFFKLEDMTDINVEIELAKIKKANVEPKWEDIKE